MNNCSSSVNDSDIFSLNEELKSLRIRTRGILNTEISFIPNAAFFNGKYSGDDGLVKATLRAPKISNKSSFENDLSPHLRRMSNVELLTQKQETALFREMNYLKFRANSLRSRLDPSNLQISVINSIEQLLKQAQEIRKYIFKANMRLVISIVKNFVTAQQSFGLLLSEGIYALIQAVDKFDFDRGFRFSTYAYHSISRAVFHFIKTARKQYSLMESDQNDLLEEGDREKWFRSDLHWNNLEAVVNKMLNQLNRRERFIIRCRHALGLHGHKRSLRELARKLGISKERVRQIEIRAIEKLQNMSGEYDLDEILPRTD